MRYTIRLLAALLTGALLACCGQALADFSYGYFNVRAESWKGRLEGKTPQDDLSFEECAPSPGKQNKCTVMLTPEFSKLKASYQKLEIDLKTCLNNQQN